MANKNKEINFQVRFSADEDKAFRKLAEAQHIPLGNLIRVLLHRLIEETSKVQVA